MDSINAILNLTIKDCFMASVDLKNAYYSAKISEKFQQYLKVEFLDKLYKFVSFPSGLAPCLRKFTQITKVPHSDLRLQKFVVSGYFDDFFRKYHTSEGCFNNVMSIAELLDKLGFLVNPDKFVLIPVQEIAILGFVINSRKMPVKLARDNMVEGRERVRSVSVLQLFIKYGFILKWLWLKMFL